MRNVHKIFLGATLLSLFWFLGSVPYVQAGDCQVSVNFSVVPNPAPANQNVAYTAIVSFNGSVFEPPGSSNAGFCLKNGKPVKSIRVGFESNETGDVDAGFKNMVAGSVGPYTFTGSVKPSDKNLKAGGKFQVRASVYTDFGARVAQSSTIIVNLTQGVFGTFACVADDGTYACSPGVHPNCDDVPNNACQDKKCISITDASQCGNQAPTATTHKACVNNACSNVPGAGPDSCATDSGCAAGGNSNPQNFEIQNPIGIDTFEELVNVIGKWIFNLAIPIAVAIIIYAGILMLTAGANSKNFQKGMDALKYAVIGLAVVLIGKGFVTLIQSILSLRNP